MLNHIAIMGRLVKDPELRRTGLGTPVASFTVAVDRDYKDDSGNRPADFISCVAWKQTAEFIAQNFTKGRMIVVTGRLQTRNWEKEGQRHKDTEIVVDSAYFADSKRPETAPDQTPYPAPPPAYDPADDDAYIPF